MTADALLAVVRASVPRVIGLSLGDPADPTTWRVDGVLTAGELALALATLHDALDVPTASSMEVPTTATPTGPTLDQVVTWAAGKFGEPLAQAQQEITAPAPAPVIAPAGSLS